MHNRYSSWVLLFAVVTLIVGSISTYGIDMDVQHQYVKAWLDSQNGFNDKNEGRLTESRQCFQKSLALFQEISHEDPNWESSLVHARIKECEDQLAVLSGTPEMPTTKTEVSDSNDRVPEKMIGTAQQAADFFKEKLYEQSAAKYQAIIDSYPEYSIAWVNLGVVRFKERQYAQSRHALAQACLLNPKDSMGFRDLGIVDLQMGNRDAAISELMKAKALDGSDDLSIQYLLNQAQAK